MTAAVILAAAIGLTRIYLRVHYLSDVEAGWGLGAGVFALFGVVALVVGRLRHNEAAGSMSNETWTYIAIGAAGAISAGRMGGAHPRPRRRRRSRASGSGSWRSC